MTDVLSLSKEDEVHMRKLDFLKSKDLMTEEEFLAKRTEILKKYQNDDKLNLHKETNQTTLVPKLPLGTSEFDEIKKKYRSQTLVPLSATTPERKERSRLLDFTTPRTQQINRLDVLIKELQGTPAVKVNGEALSPRTSGTTTPRKMEESDDTKKKDQEIESLKSRIKQFELANVKVDENELKRVMENNLIAYEATLGDKDKEIAELKKKLGASDVKKEFQNLIFEMEQEKERILVGIETLKHDYEVKIAQLEKEIQSNKM